MVKKRIGEEPAIIQADGGLPAAFCRVGWEVDLRPVGVLVAPKCAVPGAVELRQCTITFLQPELKRLFGSPIVALKGITGLVVELPSNDSRVMAIVLRQRGNNARARLQIVLA